MSETVDGPFHANRRRVKRALALLSSDRPARGATLLIYHRVGGGTPDELDLARDDFARQVELLQDHRVVHLDDAIDDVEADADRHGVVLTFDDGFSSLYDVAWPLLRAAQLPFTVYLASAYVGGREMVWPGSTAVGEPGRGLTWDQLREMLDSGLLTVANHTHDHVRPEHLDAEQLDRCTEAVERELGVTTKHFAYTWGLPAPHAEDLLAERFRTAATGRVGRVTKGDDRLRIDRVPVRASDPPEFFAAKLTGGLTAERAYALLVCGAKQALRAMTR